MRSRPLVSVVTIFLNEETFLQEAIESIRAQTHPEWELLLVDDGSTDGSTAIAQSYAERFPDRIRYLEHAGHENRGMSGSRNLGLRHAAGEYVAFLDADDTWFEDTLERQLAILTSQPDADMVYGTALWWHSWTGAAEDAARDFRDRVAERGVQAETLLRPPAMLRAALRDSGAVPCMCSLLARRSLLERIGGFEESFRGMFEDQAFYARVALAASVYVTAECFSRYRQHADSCCAVVEAAGQLAAARLAFFNWLAAYLAARGMDDAEIWQLVRAETALAAAAALPVAGP